MSKKGRAARERLTLLEEFPHIQNLADPHGLYRLSEEYLEWMRVHNYAPLTISGRAVHLCEFLDWCGQRNLHRPGEINKAILERYQRHLFYRCKKNGEPLSFRSQSTRLSAIRAWFKWLTRQNYILSNPASELELPKVEKRLPKAVLSQNEVERILQEPDVETDIGLRDRALLELLYSTGIRRTEAANLKLHDLDMATATLTVRQGKGKKDRVLPVGERALAWVEKYLFDSRPELHCNRDDGELFLSHYGLGLHPGNLTTYVRKYVVQAGIAKPGSCHLFRHAMATQMLENGADIRFIQAMLGHADLSTTEIYTQVSIKKLREVHEKTHPAAKLKRKGQSQEEGENGLEATEEALLAMLEDEGQEENE